MLSWLNNYIISNRLGIRVYRNRSGLEDIMYRFPIIQPDLYYHNAYLAPPHVRYIQIENTEYDDFKRTIITPMLQQAAENNHRLVNKIPLTRPFDYISTEPNTEFTETMEAMLKIPRLCVLNMYGHINEWEKVYEDILTSGFTSYHPEVTTMLMTHPGLRVNVFEKDNVFLVLTNTIKSDLFYLLNGCIYYIRKKLEYTMPIPEDCIDIFDNYIETIMSLNEDSYLHLWHDLDNSKRNHTLQKEQLIKKQKTKEYITAFSKVFSNSTLTRYDETIENIRSRIKNFLKDISDLQQQLRKYSLIKSGTQLDTLKENILLFGDICNDLIDTGIIQDILIRSESEYDMQEFTVDNIKYFKTLTLNMKDTLKYWDVDTAETLYENSDSILHDYADAVIMLFNSIFIDKTIKLHMTLSVDISFDNQIPIRVRDSLSRLRENVYKLGCAHPHIMYYNCWGDNEHLLTQALANEDYVTTMGIINNVLCSINLADTPVLEKLLDNINVLEDVAMYEIEGVVYKKQEALKKLKEM